MGVTSELLNETLFRWRSMPAPTWSSVRVRTGLSLAHPGQTGTAVMAG